MRSSSSEALTRPVPGSKLQEPTWVMVCALARLYSLSERARSASFFSVMSTSTARHSSPDSETIASMRT